MDRVVTVGDLIRGFSTREVVPIDVQDDVVPYLRNLGVKEELYFFEADLIDDVLKGNIEHWEYPVGLSQQGVVEISYARSLDPEWKRLVCCKELIHLLDPVDARVMTEDEFDKLVSKIGLPAELQDPLGDGAPVWNDRLAVLQAVAVLFPWNTRQLFKAPYEGGRISITEIANYVDIPRRYAALVMSDDWEPVHHYLSR